LQIVIVLNVKGGDKMPSKSKAQHNLMEAVAHNKGFAKKVGIPQSVGKDFAEADKGKKFKGGGMAKSDSKEDTKMDMAQDKAMIKKAFKMHDKQEHKGEKTDLSKLKKGGMCKKAEGGRIAAKGEHPVQKQSKRGAQIMCGGGMTKKYARGGGIEVRGKTKGKIC
jgi:hypothetical protein